MASGGTEVPDEKKNRHVGVLLKAGNVGEIWDRPPQAALTFNTTSRATTRRLNSHIIDRVV